MKWVEDGNAEVNKTSEKTILVTAKKGTESTTTEGNVVNGKKHDNDVSK